MRNSMFPVESGENDAGTQPATSPKRLPLFSQKNRANLLHIKAKR
jgi:hypothetical protein